MRVVVSCVPQTGHITPLMPLAQALAAQGDDVTVASGPDAAKAVADGGAGRRPRPVPHRRVFPTPALPQSADNFANAGLLATASAARVLMPGEVTIATMPAPAEVAAALRSLA